MLPGVRYHSSLQTLRGCGSGSHGSTGGHRAAGGEDSDPLSGAPGPGGAPLPHLQGSTQLSADAILFWPATAAREACP